MAQFQIFSWLLLGGIGILCGTSVGMVGVAVKIQAGRLPNTSQVWYCLRHNAQCQKHPLFVGALAKLQKGTVSFIMSVCTHGTT
jgi:hypothetical protein